MNLEGRCVAVTGAANGIGRATARAFSSKGAQLVLADVDQAGVEAVRKEIEHEGGQALPVVADVSTEDGVRQMLAGAMSEFANLDVAVLNAGVSLAGWAESVSVEDWRWIVDVNVWSHVHAVRAILPHFKQKGTGHFVHVSSAAGILGTPALAAYSMTKFAVFGLAESLAVSLYGTGIGVSVVCPWWVDTDIPLRGRVTADPELGMDEAALQSLGREMLRTTGIPPEKVADDIVNAVEAGRFLVLPHPEILKFAQIKWSDPEGYIRKAAEAQEGLRRLFGEKPAS